MVYSEDRSCRVCLIRGPSLLHDSTLHVVPFYELNTVGKGDTVTERADQPKLISNLPGPKLPGFLCDDDDDK